MLVQNFPIVGELVLPDGLKNYQNRLPNFVYVGGITDIRGILEMVKALEILPQELNARLLLAGNFSSRYLENEVSKYLGWEKVTYLGWQNRTQVATLLGEARAGLVLFHPLPNHINAQPNKLFEYMSAGLPVIASDFPLWREIIEQAGCGLLVDPLNPCEIAKAMQWILANPEEAQAMGERGRKAVLEKYGWQIEGQKLLDFYKAILEK